MSSTKTKSNNSNQIINSRVKAWRRIIDRIKNNFFLPWVRPKMVWRLEGRKIFGKFESIFNSGVSKNLKKINTRLFMDESSRKLAYAILFISNIIVLLMKLCWHHVEFSCLCRFTERFCEGRKPNYISHSEENPTDWFFFRRSWKEISEILTLILFVSFILLKTKNATSN